MIIAWVNLVNIYLFYSLQFEENGRICRHSHLSRAYNYTPLYSFRRICANLYNPCHLWFSFNQPHHNLFDHLITCSLDHLFTFLKDCL